MYQDRRRFYRVQVSETNPIGIRLVTGKGETGTGSALNISAGGAGVRFDAADSPKLFIGQRVTLTLLSARLGEPVSVTATTRSRLDRGTFRQYGFEFDIDIVERRMSRQLRRLFNRRTAYRVRPLTREPIFMRISRPGEKAPPPPRTARARPLEPEAGEAVEPQPRIVDPLTLVKVKNLSVRAVAVLIEPELDVALAAEDALTISFYLPGSPILQRLYCQIRRREWEGHRVLYALEYDTERSVRFEKQRDALSIYVMRRQREEWPLEHSSY